MSNPLIMRIMALSISASKKAGDIIREIMAKGELGIIDKGKNDLQTEADRSAQSCIISNLIKEFSKLKIIGEEGAAFDADYSGVKHSDCLITEMDKDFLEEKCPENLKNLSIDDFTIWVDPLDGTSEYTQGFLEHVTVLIGIAANSSPVGGVIHQPYYKQPCGDYGRTIWGLKGLGSSLELKNARLDKFIVTTTRSHSTEIVQSSLDSLNATDIIRVGGAGFKVLQLLEGTAHAYVFASPGCKKWDTCAPEAILETLGGTLTDIRGNHYEYHPTVEHPNYRGVVATVYNSHKHQEIIERIPDNVKNALVNK